MPSDTAAIRVEGLSKAYRKGVSGSTRLTEWRPSMAQGGQEFWALKDVSFEVATGSVVGIIGRNGAGKSTLLKILARVTPPTTGNAWISGRVASLLEVGTGFHQELTGSENIFLSAAILGMSRKETQRRLDQIVEFSGIGDFIDTPVKRYSSGMYVRLGFSVAAHLDADVLLVDEVLAVGDAEFRKRCLGRIDDITDSGRTVLLVSHDMATVSQLAESALWLQDGRLESAGDPTGVIGSYMDQLAPLTNSVEVEPDPDASVALLHASFDRGFASSVNGPFSVDDDLRIRLTIEIKNRLPGLYGAFYLRKDDGSVALFSDSRDLDPSLIGVLETGRHELGIRIPARTLAPGTYSLTVGLSSPMTGSEAHYADLCKVTLHDFKSIRGDARPGVIGTLLEWKAE